MKKYLPLLAIMLTSQVIAQADPWQNYYQIDNIPIPKQINPQIGGLQALQDGRIAVAFYAGEVMIYDPKTQTWSQFAKGLDNPLGLIEEKSGALVLMQTPELTRLIDEDKDGRADFYQTVSDQFGMSGNYHEFAFGPARDSKGNYYISLNVASNFAGIFEKIRGDFSPIGLSREQMTDWQNDTWKNETKFKAGRMFAKVSYRGWILKITPDGQTIPFASGFRSPDGLHVDSHDRLWVTDNQGDWLGTSPLYQVKEGKHYGHPASLVWKKDWQQDPVTMSAEALAKLRTLPSALFPHGELANSPTQPISTIDPALFGLPKNELLIGDMNQARLIRYLPDEVNGFMQGTFIPFIESKTLGIGNHRFDFDNNGNLWVGKTHLGWAGDEGVRKISWNQKALLLADKVSQTKTGFAIHFTQAISQQQVQITVASHTYHYHADYGSEKVDLQNVAVLNQTISKDQKTLLIDLPKLVKNRLYTIELKGINTESGEALMGDILRYNLVEKAY
ncbi:hypothetical protein [Paraglaciecola sp. L3A3]|uniref:hypothetical protein n=1 Tax=Paraglaciecola sp. L3A3 TaxID=2686358 RepID=UPI00131C7508|nr:hypothetical protein [Paraglaciecola sp. L3A3]